MKTNIMNTKTNFMKSNFKFLAIIAFFGILLNSCSSDDDNSSSSLDAPEITNFEYGEGSSHSTDQAAYTGSDIHIEADIYAEGVVNSITLSIHSHDAVPGDGEIEWDFTQVYDGADYQAINPTFHVHVDVPEYAAQGEYHIELVVVDELGNSTEMEGHIDIINLITFSNVDIDETVVRGEDIHMDIEIGALNGIHELTVDFHGEDVTIGTGDVEWDGEFDFSADFHDQTEADFHTHIDVPATAPVGEYHVTITVEDEDGNTESYETHIDVTAS